MDVRTPPIIHRVPFRFRENLARLSKEFHAFCAPSSDAVLNRPREMEGADTDEIPAEPLGAVRCGECGFMYHPACATCVGGGTVVVEPAPDFEALLADYRFDIHEKIAAALRECDVIVDTCQEAVRLATEALSAAGVSFDGACLDFHATLTEQSQRPIADEQAHAILQVSA